MNVEIATLPELESHYYELLSSSVNVEPDPEPSFLNISGFPHYEEVISNWYAFFFTSAAHHGFGTLFVDSLVELINQAPGISDIPSFEKCSVIRERNVEGKSIDLLLYDEAVLSQNDTDQYPSDPNQKEIYKNVVIIENKMHAALYNDLSHYFRSINADETKIGVVLSLTPHSNLPKDYVNILHKDLLDRVFSNIGKYIFRSSTKYLLLFKDFAQEIQMFKKTDTMKPYINFYFEHAEKINELYILRNKAFTALLEELGKELGSTNFKWGRRYPDSLNIRYKKHENVLLILMYDKLFDESKYKLDLWLTNSFAKKWSNPALQTEIAGITNIPEKFTLNIKKTGQNYALIGTQEICLERTRNNIEQFPETFAAKLTQQWEPFVETILNVAGR